MIRMVERNRSTFRKHLDRRARHTAIVGNRSRETAQNSPDTRVERRRTPTYVKHRFTSTSVTRIFQTLNVTHPSHVLSNT